MTLNDALHRSEATWNAILALEQYPWDALSEEGNPIAGVLHTLMLHEQALTQEIAQLREQLQKGQHHGA